MKRCSAGSIIVDMRVAAGDIEPAALEAGVSALPSQNLAGYVCIAAALGESGEEATVDKEAAELFAACDKEDEMLLSHNEIKIYLIDNPWAIPWINAEAFDWEALMVGYDDNKDGSLDLGEFIRLYREKLYIVPLYRPTTGPIITGPTAPAASLQEAMLTSKPPLDHTVIERQLAVERRATELSAEIAFQSGNVEGLRAALADSESRRALCEASVARVSELERELAESERRLAESEGCAGPLLDPNNALLLTLTPYLLQ